MGLLCLLPVRKIDGSGLRFLITSAARFSGDTGSVDPCCSTFGLGETGWLGPITLFAAVLLGRCGSLCALVALADADGVVLRGDGTSGERDLDIADGNPALLARCGCVVGRARIVTESWEANAS